MVLVVVVVVVVAVPAVFPPNPIEILFMNYPNYTDEELYKELEKSSISFVKTYTYLNSVPFTSTKTTPCVMLRKQRICPHHSNSRCPIRHCLNVVRRLIRPHRHVIC